MSEYEKHPSYGMIQIHRGSGGDPNLFGSSIPNNHKITLSIHPAELRRDLNEEWFYASPHAYIEVEMSPTQWAEAITNMNSSGTPVTIRYIDGKAVEACPFTNKRQQFQEEFTGSLRELAQRLAALEELADSIASTKAPNKDQKSALVAAVGKIKQDLESNLPFVLKQFNRQMDKTVLEAKGEFEAMVTHTIHSLGLKALKAEDFRLIAASSEEGEEG